VTLAEFEIYWQRAGISGRHKKLACTVRPQNETDDKRSGAILRHTSPEAARQMVASTASMRRFPGECFRTVSRRTYLVYDLVKSREAQHFSHDAFVYSGKPLYPRIAESR
jgi:hypothetical protein